MSDAVIWHDLECGSLPGGPVAVARAGCASAAGRCSTSAPAPGRVALDARPRGTRGRRRSTATPSCSPSSTRRAAGLPAETVVRRRPRRSSSATRVPAGARADADGPAARRPEGRPAFLACARRHLARAAGCSRSRSRRGFEEFELDDGEPAPLPDVSEHDGFVLLQPADGGPARRRRVRARAPARDGQPRR